MLRLFLFVLKAKRNGWEGVGRIKRWERRLTETFPSMLTHHSIPAFSQNPLSWWPNPPPSQPPTAPPLPLLTSRSPNSAMATPLLQAFSRIWTASWWRHYLHRRWSRQERTPALSPPTAPPHSTNHPAPHPHPWSPALTLMNRAVESPVGTTRWWAEWRRAEKSHLVMHSP